MKAFNDCVYVCVTLDVCFQKIIRLLLLWFVKIKLKQQKYWVTQMHHGNFHSFPWWFQMVTTQVDTSSRNWNRNRCVWFEPITSSSWFTPVTSLCQSVPLSVYLAVCLSLWWSVALSDCWSAGLSVSVALSLCWSVCLSDCRSVGLSVAQSVCLSVCGSVGPSVGCSVSRQQSLLWTPC